MTNDVEAAGTASGTALLVVPDDEKILLDAMRVAYREGNCAAAETYVARIIDVPRRRERDGPPIEHCGNHQPCPASVPRSCLVEDIRR